MTLSETPRLDPDRRVLDVGPVRLEDLRPLLDGEVPAHGPAVREAGRLVFPLAGDLAGARVVLVLERRDPAAAGEGTDAGDPPPGAVLVLTVAAEGLPSDLPVEAVGLRIGGAANVRQYLRSGYTSWDGSYFVEPDAAAEVVAADPGIAVGHAVTALLPREGEGAVVVGLLRHDRFQSRFRFRFRDGPLSIDVETLWDRVPHDGRVAAEPLVVFHQTGVEAALRSWARMVAGALPGGARLSAPRITGWCSWYNLYAAIDEASIRHHLDAAARFREARRVPLRVFQIDDGFTPEMGDWLDVKPQFPRGMAPLLAEIADRGFVPGLWIAPFMVGNRSRLYREHPDWVVRDRASGRPIHHMHFYGEFRWHKRSEEYHILDVTHPEAEAYIRVVFRTWRRDWGCGYFKTDFMHFGSEYGPDRARWHRDGLSRIAIWMIMARLIREEIGDALWLACGAPIWAPVGLVDAVRIGRDVGVSWTGHYSAESLLRDQTARNFAHAILWQADPDCVLLRERFHDLDDDEIRALAGFAALSGGVLTTSDDLDEVPAAHADLFAVAAAEPLHQIDVPDLGRTALRYRLGTYPDGRPMAVAVGDPVLIRRVRRDDGRVVVHLLNTGDRPVRRLVPWRILGGEGPRPVASATPLDITADGVLVTAGRHQGVTLVAG